MDTQKRIRHTSLDWDILRAMLKSFFPMDRVDALALAFLVAFSIFSFLPMWRGAEIAGMAVFGWMMAALMVLSPALALVVISRKGKR